MKQLFFFLFLLLLPIVLLAQRPSGSAPAIAGIPPGGGYSYPETRSTYQLRADSALQALDKSQAVTGILYDRVAGTAYLDLFNRAHNDLDTSNVYHFLQRRTTS